MGATFSRTYFLATSFAVSVALLIAVRALARREPPWRTAHVFRVIMIGAFSVGTCTHLENMWRAGLVLLPSQPLAFNVYWTSLTLLDPLAAFLLVTRPRAGLILGGAIMVSDVAINACAFPPRGAIQLEWAFWLQASFAAFLLSVSPSCWRSLNREPKA